MRNLLEYPITTDEISKCLETLLEEKLKIIRPGDMTCSLLSEAIKIVKNTNNYKFEL